VWLYTFASGILILLIFAKKLKQDIILSDRGERVESVFFAVHVSPSWMAHLADHCLDFCKNVPDLQVFAKTSTQTPRQHP